MEEIAMPHPQSTGNPKSGRYYVRIPARSVAELSGYIKESGMYQAPFLSNALVVGARHLAPQREQFAQQPGAVEYQRLMRKALDKLAPEQREVLELAYFEGLSQLAIAAKLGQRLGIIDARMRMAIRNLTTLLYS
jgi:DNA-directed RNA polymerase specialized sigma24 family protein